MIYRVVQAALTNVSRHAAARRAELRVEQDARGIHVAVRDDGRGMAGPPPHDGGFRGMRERALLVGGTVAVDSPPAGGTQVVLQIPAGRR